MDKEILKVFHDGRNTDLPLEDIRGGWCLVNNPTCSSGESSCNVNKCTPDKITTPDQDPNPNPSNGAM